MPFPTFDRSVLKLKPLSERVHDMDLSHLLKLDDPIPPFSHPFLDILAERMRAARERKAAVIFMMGAHVIKAGASNFVIELMKQGWVTHCALNGAGAIHDFELALIGATTESVARYIRTGEFGMWQETGDINLAAAEGLKDGLGLGEAVGRMIVARRFPHSENSILATGYRLQVPVTVHVSIGCDIIHQHPSCDGAVLGAASYHDFLVFAHSVSRLEGGVFINFGSAVTGPEVYLKALSMARNAAGQEGKEIRHFTTAVCDLYPLPAEDYRNQPTKEDHRYYFRPWKTILVRTVADGGESYYIQGDHRAVIPNLAAKLLH
ncbi:MAG TPA: hypothetical protein GXX29_03975 [Firmicutes bacterium]|nr:hypothetical protein [Bacillota bacterium]